MAVKLSIISKYDPTGTKAATQALSQFERKYNSAKAQISESTTGIARASIALQQHGMKLSNYGNKLKGFGSALTKYVTAPALGAAAALGGITLAKGWARLETIDDAKKKLEGLGHSAKSIDAIMASASASVKGTAFGLGDAATVAASTVAAGIEEGEELTRVLTLIGDSATIAGTDFASMGNIWNKVAAKNKLSSKEVNQLTQRGIPILQALADHYGITANEAADMVSRGKVDFKAFSDSMESYLGGAAQKSGEKFSGAMKNIGAAVGRIGANLLDGSGGGMFSQLKPVLEDVRAGLSSFEDEAAKWGDVLGAAFAQVYERGKDLVAVFMPSNMSLTPAADAATRAKEIINAAFDAIITAAKIVKGAISAIPPQMRGWILAAGPLLKIAGGLTSVFGRMTIATGKTVARFANFVAAQEIAAQKANVTTGAMVKQTAKAKLLGTQAGKLGGLARTAAGGLAAIGVALAVGLLVKFIAKLKTTNTALHGFKDGADLMAESAANASGKIETSAAAVGNYRDAVSDAIEKQAEFAERANETYANAGTEIGKLDYYAGIIEKYGNAGELTAQQQAELAAAVEYVNDATGKNYEITDAANGALSETPEAIQKAIEAKKKEIEADAALAVYQEAVEQHIKNQIALRKASAAASDYSAKAEQAAMEGNAAMADYYAREASAAEQQVKTLTAAEDGLTEEMNDALEIYGDITGETVELSDETKKAKEESEKWSKTTAASFEKVKGAASNALGTVKSKFKDFNTYKWGKDFGDNWKKGLEAAKIDEAARGIMDKVAKYMKFSVPKAGVWSGSERGGFTSGQHLGQNWAAGLMASAAGVQQAANAALGFTVPTIPDPSFARYQGEGGQLYGGTAQPANVTNYNIHIDGIKASSEGIEDACGRFLQELAILGAI